jgi:hypothetical protein
MAQPTTSSEPFDTDDERPDLRSHGLLERGRRSPVPAPQGSLDWRQAAGGALVGLGFIATIVAWYGVSGTLDPGEQMPYISSGGFGGAALIALGVTLLVGFEHARGRAALRDVLDELDAVRADLASLDRALQQAQPAPSTNGTATKTTRAAKAATSR